MFTQYASTKFLYINFPEVCQAEKQKTSPQPPTHFPSNTASPVHGNHRWHIYTGNMDWLEVEWILWAPVVLSEHQSSIPWPLARKGLRFLVSNIATHMVQEGNWVEDWTGGSSECPWWTVGHKQRGFQNTGGDTFNVCTPGVNSWLHGCELVTSSWYQSILQFWTQTERFSKHTGGYTFTYTWVNSWSQICEFFLLLLVNQYHML